jgi:hypothetical protein
MKVLLIEDDAKTAAFVKRGLEEHGHVVDSAGNGRDGLFLALMFVNFTTLPHFCKGCFYSPATCLCASSCNGRRRAGRSA